MLNEGEGRVSSGRKKWNLCIITIAQTISRTLPLEVCYLCFSFSIFSAYCIFFIRSPSLLTVFCAFLPLSLLVRSFSIPPLFWLFTYHIYYNMSFIQSDFFHPRQHLDQILFLALFIRLLWIVFVTMALGSCSTHTPTSIHSRLCWLEAAKPSRTLLILVSSGH